MVKVTGLATVVSVVKLTDLVVVVNEVKVTGLVVEVNEVKNDRLGGSGQCSEKRRVW